MRLVLVAVVGLLTVATLVGFGPLAAPTSHTADPISDAAGARLALVHPSGPVPSASGNVTNASVNVTSTLPTYTVLPEGPVPVDFTLNVTSATITPQNVTLWADVEDELTGALCENLSLESLVTNNSNLSNLSSQFLNTSFNVSSSTMNATSLLLHCPGVLTDPVEFVVRAAIQGNVPPINGTNITANSNTTFEFDLTTAAWVEIDTTPATSLVFSEPTENLLFSESRSTYTYNLSAAYTGQYVGRVALTVYSSTEVHGTRSVLLSKSLLAVGGVEPVISWYEPTGGNYPYTLQLFTPYTNVTTSGILAINNASYVYYNSTSNVVKGLGGLSPAASDTVLLLVGLIIGFVVMFVVARWLLGPGAGGPAPKQWSGPEGKAPSGASNTCSFCGRTFGSPEELAAHAKSEHGVE